MTELPQIEINGNQIDIVNIPIFGQSFFELKKKVKNFENDKKREQIRIK